MTPAELGARLARIAQERIDLGRPKIARIHLDQYLARRFVDAFLLDASPAPRAFIRMLWCVSTMPLGSLVEPEEN